MSKPTGHARSVPTFIRFVVGADGEHHRRLTGLVAEARELRDSDALTADEEQWLEDTYGWLNRHLPCPPFSRSRWSRQAVCWFKDSSRDAITRVRQLGLLLESHGRLVRKLRSNNPGKILYEDDHQVVVMEWRTL